MSYNFYDWNNALQQRNEYVEDRLKDGSPVVAVSFEGGVLLLTLRSTAQRKIFEVYDRLIMGALGKQSDIESLRLASIDTAHKEGFERSPDDVSIQRLVGFSLSPAVKRVYNDQQTIPLTFRAVFAELGKTMDDDQLFILGYDGEFKSAATYAVAAGTPYAEEQAEEKLREAAPQTQDDALRAALIAWGTGRLHLSPTTEKPDEDDDPLSFSDLRDADGDDALATSNDPAVALREALKNGATVEAGILQRNTQRESRFRLLKPGELETALSDYK